MKKSIIMLMQSVVIVFLLQQNVSMRTAEVSNEAMEVYIYPKGVAFFSEGIVPPAVFNETKGGIVSEPVPDGWCIAIEGGWQ